VLRFRMNATGFGSGFVPLGEIPHGRRIPLSPSCSPNVSRVQCVRDCPKGLHAVFPNFTNYRHHIGRMIARGPHGSTMLRKPAYFAVLGLPLGQRSSDTIGSKRRNAKALSCCVEKSVRNGRWHQWQCASPAPTFIINTSPLGSLPRLVRTALRRPVKRNALTLRRSVAGCAGKGFRPIHNRPSR
jgi:hypothetical protein